MSQRDNMETYLLVEMAKGFISIEAASKNISEHLAYNGPIIDVEVGVHLGF
jgi:hypothetical protein